MTDKGFTLCVLLHVPKMHISQITDNRQSFLLGGGQEGRSGLCLLKRVLPRPTPQLYQERLKQYCLWYTKRLVVSAHSRTGPASQHLGKLEALMLRQAGSACTSFSQPVCTTTSTPGQQLWVFASRNTYFQIHIQGGRVERLYKEFIAVFVSSLHRNKTTMKSA